MPCLLILKFNITNIHQTMGGECWNYIAVDLFTYLHHTSLPVTVLFSPSLLTGVETLRAIRIFLPLAFKPLHYVVLPFMPPDITYEILG